MQMGMIAMVGPAVRRTFCLLCALYVLALAPSSASAARVILRIKAVNPIDKSQVVKIRSNLPQGISSNDVLNADGLSLGYDVQNDVYFVHKDVPLSPKQVQAFNIELRDIWSIPDDELNGLLARADKLAGMLNGTAQAGLAAELRGQVESGVRRIQQAQGENALRPGVPPMQHIAAYEGNTALLGKAKRDVGHIENLVLETGQDPGALVGEDSRTLRLRRDIELPTDSYEKVVWRIQLRNTSPTEKRTLPIRQELPSEIKADDVLDAGGLDLSVNPENGLCVVSHKGVEVAPGETATFQVTMRDKWDISKPRIASLSQNASNLLARITTKQRFASIEAMLKSAMADLSAIASEQGPAELSPEYVAFYRGQARRIDDLEQRINRVRAALNPIDKGKLGFPMPPPSVRTTWLIIYVVLAFLGIVSLLFFLRWYGRSREEQMWAALSKPSAGELGDESAAKRPESKTGG